MKSIWDTFMEYLNGRAKTRVYSLFIVWFLIFHINVIFFSLFVEQQYIFEKYNLLKNEYITSYILNPYTLMFWLSELLKLLLAAVMTYVMIFILPNLITKKTYNRELMDEYELKFSKLRKEQELADEKNKIVKKELSIALTESSLQTEQLKIEKNEEQQWNEDFDEFANSSVYKNFDELTESIFKRNGKVKEYDYNGGVEFEMNGSLLAYLTSTDVVAFDQKDGIVSLTEKGKHFIKKHQLI